MRRSARHLCVGGSETQRVWGLCLYLARHRGALGGERRGPLKSSLPQIQSLANPRIHATLSPSGMRSLPSSLNFPTRKIERAEVGSQAAGFPTGRLPSSNPELPETLNPNGRPDAPGQEAAPARISLSGGAAMTHSLPLP